MKRLIAVFLAIFVLVSLFTGCVSRQQEFPSQESSEKGFPFLVEPNIWLQNDITLWDSKTAKPAVVALSALPLDVRKMACSNRPLNIFLNGEFDVNMMIGGALYFPEKNHIMLGQPKNIPYFMYVVLHEFGHAIDYNPSDGCDRQFLNDFPDEEEFANDFAKYVFSPEKLTESRRDWFRENIFKTEPDRDSIQEWLRSTEVKTVYHSSSIDQIKTSIFLSILPWINEIGLLILVLCGVIFGIIIIAMVAGTKRGIIALIQLLKRPHF